jgi:hypothetical protein
VLSDDLERRITGIESELHGPRAGRIVTKRTLADGSVVSDPLLLTYEQIANIDGNAVRQSYVALTTEDLKEKVEERRAVRELESAIWDSSDAAQYR